MIRLNRPSAPAQLTPKVVESLTDAFKADGTVTVWNQPYIRNALMSMAHNKCVYCETRIDEESKYMEVDHCYCKDRYPDRVIEWNNLLPSCKRCNANKGSHDVATGQIIDPTLDRPADHLSMRNYRFRGRDQKGRSTIGVLYLNQTDRVVSKRFDIGNYVEDNLDALKERWDQISNNNKGHTSVARRLAALMQEAQPPSEYSATAATCIIGSSCYAELKAEMIAKRVWIEECPASTPVRQN